MNCIDPPLRICGTNRRAVSTAAKKFTENCSENASAVLSANDTTLAIPAFGTRRPVLHSRRQHPSVLPGRKDRYQPQGSGRASASDGGETAAHNHAAYSRRGSRLGRSPRPHCGYQMAGPSVEIAETTTRYTGCGSGTRPDTLMRKQWLFLESVY